MKPEIKEEAILMKVLDNNMKPYDWHSLIVNNYIDENVIKKYINKFGIIDIINNTNMSLNFIEYIIDNFNLSIEAYKAICIRQIITQKLASKIVKITNCNFLVISLIFTNQIISEDILLNYLSRLLKYTVENYICNNIVCFETVKKILNRFPNFKLETIFSNVNLNIEQIEYIFNNYSIQRSDLYELIRYQKLTENFIDKHWDKLSDALYAIISFQNLSQNFIDNHIEYFNTKTRKLLLKKGYKNIYGKYKI